MVRTWSKRVNISLVHVHQRRSLLSIEGSRHSPMMLHDLGDRVFDPATNIVLMRAPSVIVSASIWPTALSHVVGHVVLTRVLPELVHKDVMGDRTDDDVVYGGLAADASSGLYVVMSHGRANTVTTPVEPTINELEPHAFKSGMWRRLSHCPSFNLDIVRKLYLEDFGPLAINHRVGDGLLCQI
jgi:hypothetical protein